MHLTFGEPCSNTLSGRESNFKTDQVLRSRTRLRLANISDPSRAKAAFQASRKRVIPAKTAENLIILVNRRRWSLLECRPDGCRTVFGGADHFEYT